MELGEWLSVEIQASHVKEASMAQTLRSRHFDVIIVGGGPTGVVAAMAATRNGARTLLVETGPFLGGDLVSGSPIDGCLNPLGEWIVGGPARELFDACQALGGYIGPICDWRTMYGVCLDPELMKVAVVQVLARYGVPVLLYTFVEDVITDGRRIVGVVAVEKSQRSVLTAPIVLDCSGDGDVAVLAGAEHEKGDQCRALQPVSYVYRLANVDYRAYLDFVRDNPEQFLLGQNAIYGKTPAECAAEVVRAGHPFAALSAKASMLGEAIRSGDMFPCGGIFVWPTSIARREVGINVTRVGGVDATDSEQLSSVQATLMEQVLTSIRFLQRRVAGFGQSLFSGIAPRIGVRETRRIIGDYVLTAEDVLTGRKRQDGVAKGGHHVDIHGSGMDHTRKPIEGGRSYDIPYGCLIPRGLDNVYISGRCLSSTREANSSARVMGTCMATGQAAGTAAGLCIARGLRDVRALPVEELRQALRAQGAVIDGTR